MQPQTDVQSKPFVDRRNPLNAGAPIDGQERRQFRDSQNGLRPEVAELANAIDHYKLTHRRRFITFEELYDVVISLGYQKQIEVEKQIEV